MSIRKAICFLLFIALIASATVCIAEYVPFASLRYKTTIATLSSKLYLSASASTYDDCSEFGVKSYTLYKADGTRVMSSSPEDYTSGHRCSFSVDLSGYGKSGTSYYAVVTFNADGETKSKTSKTIKF